MLTLAGVEIEGIEKRGANFDNVVVAQITASSQHPNADRLSVCQVDDGSGQTRQIVCGAKNYKVGDKVPLALPGAILPNDLEIKREQTARRRIAGHALQRERARDRRGRGRAADSFARRAKVGAPIGDVFPDDTILDVEITPNRGDLLSHYGLAREIAALTGKPLRDAAIRGSRTSAVNRQRRGNSARLTNAHSIPRAGLKTSQSARARIGCARNWKRSGMRSINNIVDIYQLRDARARPAVACVRRR